MTTVDKKPRTAEEIRQERIDRLKPYQIKKGQRLNPNGRPAGIRYFTEAYADILSTDIPESIAESQEKGLDVIEIALAKLVKRGAKVVDFVALAIVTRAMQGDVAAIKELTDRTEGRVVQKIEQKIDASPPLDTEAYELDNLTPDELEQLIALYAKATKGKPPRVLEAPSASVESEANDGSAGADV